MNIKTKLSITLILLIIFGVCCSQSSQSVAIVTESDSLLEYEVKELPIETASVVLDEDNTDTEDVIRPENWSEESHSNDVDPNYDVVFPEDQVNQIVITIGPEDWALMQANMTELFGTAGSGKSGGFGGQGGKNPQTGEQPGNLQPPTNDQAPPEIPEDKMGNGPGKGVQPPVDGELIMEVPEGNIGNEINLGSISSENPMWVEATIEFAGNTWNHVGIRYKGNSSLKTAWDSGDSKLPFKLDFDEFEDLYTELDDQRFYGFKQLSFANAYKDESFLRDALTSDILKDAGLPAAETAFVEVFLDYGEGPVSLGLYTMIEVVDDTVIETYFGDDDGNIYDAAGTAATFAATSFDQIESSFSKENNEDSDWSDIEELFDVLHSNIRLTDPDAWRSNLETVFDVDGFIEWLALAAALNHWDSYGSMSHNYYLYHDPDTDLLTWISWDHNEVLQSSGGGRSFSIDKEDINENWPLIRYLLDDEVYAADYTACLENTINNVMDPETSTENIESMAELIAPYASEEIGEEAFNRALEELINQVYQQVSLVEEYLNENK